MAAPHREWRLRLYDLELHEQLIDAYARNYPVNETSKTAWAICMLVIGVNQTGGKIPPDMLDALKGGGNG